MSLATVGVMYMTNYYDDKKRPELIRSLQKMLQQCQIVITYQNRFPFHVVKELHQKSEYNHIRCSFGLVCEKDGSKASPQVEFYWSSLNLPQLVAVTGGTFQNVLGELDARTLCGWMAHQKCTPASLFVLNEGIGIYYNCAKVKCQTKMEMSLGAIGATSCLKNHNDPFCLDFKMCDGTPLTVVACDIRECSTSNAKSYSFEDEANAKKRFAHLMTKDKHSTLISATFSSAPFLYQWEDVPVNNRTSVNMLADKQMLTHDIKDLGNRTHLCKSAKNAEGIDQIADCFVFGSRMSEVVRTDGDNAALQSADESERKPCVVTVLIK